MIIVGVSGGVDSSVATLLLKKGGENVRGVFMHNWEDNDIHCRANEDRLDALRVCSSLSVPFSTRNFSKEYMDGVFTQFLDGYSKGFTPNPDILCNREVKFKVFLEDCINNGADKIATGHYVRKGQKGNRATLLRGRDPSKDQSYFLHAITQDALSKSVFPIGDLEKSEVRKIANDYGFVTANKKDSTGICFIGEQDFKSFLAKYLPASPGHILTQDGRAIGTHNGALYYTVGQRAPVGGVKGFDASIAWFILKKDVANNTLIVGQGHDHPSLIHSSIMADNFSWIANSAPKSNFEAEVQIRHLGETRPCSVVVGDDGLVSMSLASPHRAAALGQSAVLYQGDVCLGGGEIVMAV